MNTQFEMGSVTLNQDSLTEDKSQMTDQSKGGEDDVVNPWNVESKSNTGIDYDKLISKYN